ncbi:DNA-binding protein WhiA [Fervidobacterium thailandense]|uniref:DNA-binding protein WhiA n=1 Tax=Fervidobacterium thailandense TaxID=1008305 RepID=UPI000845D718|nr:DNA-binding protein WhiA [Fervidobacterium thailandense]
MKYTFSEEVKSELCQVEVLSPEEAEAELVGYLKGRGLIVKSNVDSYVTLEVGFIPAARRVMNLLHFLGIDKKRLTLLKNRMKRKRVQIFVPLGILEKLEISVLEIPKFLSDDIGFLGAFLRGLFVSCGSVTDPAKHYHFEIVSQNEELLRYLDQTLAEYMGISGNVTRMGSYAYRYFVKRGKDIQELLELMGAQRSAAQFEKIVSSREIKCDINRSLNFISANAKRSGESAAKQIEAINLVQEKIGLERLPEELRKVALARLEFADLPLSELGQQLDPPLSKTMVYTRLRRIMRLAKHLENAQLGSSQELDELLKQLGTVRTKKRKTRSEDMVVQSE